MDSSIPTGLPPRALEELQELNNEFSDGYLTEKGYIKKKKAILSKYEPNTQIFTEHSTPETSSRAHSHNRAYSETSGLTRISTVSSKPGLSR